MITRNENKNLSLYFVQKCMKVTLSDYEKIFIEK